jgi:hypothetical protein
MAAESGDQALSGARDQSQNDQQDNGPNKGVDDRGNEAAADCNADLREQPTCDQAADDTNDNVADQSVAAALDHHTGKPTGNGADDQPNDECLCVHVSPHLLARKKPCSDGFLCIRFFDGPGRREAAADRHKAAQFTNV